MRILFFSPFSGILEFSILEARLAKGLAREGHDVIMATCGGLFYRHCVVMAAHGLQSNSSSVQRHAVCKDCSMYAEVINNNTQLYSVNLAAMLSYEEQAEVKGLVDSLDNDSALTLKEDEIPVGRRSLYPFLALKKKSSLNLSKEEWLDYRDQLCNTLLAARSANILFDRYQPDVVMTYSSTYSITSTCLEVARNRGIKDYFIEASSCMGSRDYRTILARGGISQWYAGLIALWEERREQPARPEYMRLVTKHMLYLFKSKSALVYSTSTRSGNFDTRKYFGANDEQKILLATMSSYDEWFAAEQAGLFPMHKSVFPSQLEWIELLFDIMRRRPDLFLIIRVHPREFPNQRDSIYAENLGKLKSIIETAPPNCRINWPEQKLSLYDIAKNVSVVLNAWSSSGKDLTLLGLPVVEWAADLLLYPPEPRYVAHNVAEYEACINRALEDGWNANRIRNMYRWLSLEFGAATFKSSTEIHTESYLLEFIHKVKRGIKRKLSNVLVFKEFLNIRLPSHACQNITNAIGLNLGNLAQLELNRAVDIKIEEQALKKEIKSLLFGLFGADDDGDNLLKKALMDFSRSPLSSEKFEKKL